MHFCLLCRFRCESESDDNLILRNCDVRQVGRLDAEVCHVHGAGCGSCYRIAYNFSLHIKDLFVGFAVQGQVTSQLKMHRLTVCIA